ncbi:hypothetical protein [Hymenobacter bucti]|uniref:Uncharacterized protein n=1 Tax=Hymenobacter bucti TaxID=1844114 RepID=A0ABW4QXD6_9BACT
MLYDMENPALSCLYWPAAVLLLALAHVAKAAVDTLTHQAGNDIFERLGPWFDARTSWLNKYKAGSWELGTPVPRFLGSTTVFAFVTDFWHAADMVYLTSYAAGAGLLGILVVTSSGWVVAAGAGWREGRRRGGVPGVLPAVSGEVVPWHAGRWRSRLRNQRHEKAPALRSGLFS